MKVKAKIIDTFSDVFLISSFFDKFHHIVCSTIQYGTEFFKCVHCNGFIAPQIGYCVGAEAHFVNEGVSCNAFAFIGAHN